MKKINLIVLILATFACSREDTALISEPVLPTFFASPAEFSGVVETEKQNYMVDTVVTDLESPWGMIFSQNTW